MNPRIANPPPRPTAAVFLAAFLGSSARAASLLVPPECTRSPALAASQDNDAAVNAPASGTNRGAGSLRVNQKRITNRGSGADATVRDLGASGYVHGPLFGVPLILTDGTVRGAWYLCINGNVAVCHCTFETLGAVSPGNGLPSTQPALEQRAFMGIEQGVMGTPTNGASVADEVPVLFGVVGGDPTTPRLRAERTVVSDVDDVGRRSLLCNAQGISGGAIRGNATLIEDCLCVYHTATGSGGVTAVGYGSRASRAAPSSRCHSVASADPGDGAVTASASSIALISDGGFDNSLADIGGGVHSAGPGLVHDTTVCGNLSDDISTGGTYKSGNTSDVDCGPACDSDRASDDSAIVLWLVEDVDEDGVPDHRVPVFFSADINGDCVVNGAELGMASAGSAANCGLADVNQDDLVHGSALARVLGQWSSV